MTSSFTTFLNLRVLCLAPHLLARRGVVAQNIPNMPKRQIPASSDSNAKRAKSFSTPTITTAATIKAKQDKAPISSEAQEDDDGNTFWELNAGGMRRATVSEFKGTTMVSIREYYVDKTTGQHKPGSKVSLMELCQGNTEIE